MAKASAERVDPPVYTIATVDIDTFDDEGREKKPQKTRKVTHYRLPVNDGPVLNPIDKLTLSTEVSIRYHQRRKNHYDGVYKWMIFGVIMMAAGGVFLNLNQPELFGLGTVAIAGFTLVWNLTQKSREHDILRNRYQNLLEQIRMTGEPSKQDLYNWRTIRLNIQADEPPMHWAVVNDCYYDVARAWDLRPKKKSCPLILRPFMNWIRF